MKGKCVVLVSCGSRREAGRIARALVEDRLAACVNVLQSPVESVYRWKGKIERARETLLIIKTSLARFPRLERRVRALHGYQTPEIIALPIVAGSRPYLDWIEESLRARRAASRRGIRSPGRAPRA